MTAEDFDKTLRALQSATPYTVFTVELNSGERFEVDSPFAFVVRDGVAVFVASGGMSTWFDHTSVNQIIGPPANMDR